MNPIRRIVKSNYWFIRKGKPILFFLNGFLVGLLLYFYIEKQYEHKLFASLAGYVQVNSSATDNIPDEDSLFINCLNLVHSLGENRLAIFSSNNVGGIKGKIIQPVSVDLMTAQGACGSHSYILARLLEEMNKKTRIPQMTVEGQNAGHIIVEVKASYGWVVLDPLSGTFFRKDDGHLASFDDVKNDWEFYQQQVPTGYNMSYRYEGVRYTNWDKIPVVMPLIKNILYWTMGKEKTDSYSLRSLGLKKYNLLFNITLGAYVIVCLFTANLFVKARRKKAALAKANIFEQRNNAALPTQPGV